MSKRYVPPCLVCGDPATGQLTLVRGGSKSMLARMARSGRLAVTVGPGCDACTWALAFQRVLLALRELGRTA